MRDKLRAEQLLGGPPWNRLCDDVRWLIHEIRVLWKRIEIVAIVDGFSRKIIAMKAFGRRSASKDLAELAESTIESGGASPRFLVTDHGSQFRSGFRASIESFDIMHVRCQFRTWQFNAKVEWVLEDMKLWVRRSALPMSMKAVQGRFDTYSYRYNRYRPLWAFGTLTPYEAERGASAIEAVLYRQRRGVEP